MASPGLLDRGTSEVINPDTYFEIHKPPRTLAEDEVKVREFVNKHRDNRRIVLVTSGGTTVPLENNT
ncbi:7388_t:CDS:2, partial [Acaulospora morrowiae]